MIPYSDFSHLLTFYRQKLTGNGDNDGAAVRVELHLEGDEGGVDLELLRPRDLDLGVRPRSHLGGGGGHGALACPTHLGKKATSRRLSE